MNLKNDKNITNGTLDDNSDQNENNTSNKINYNLLDKEVLTDLHDIGKLIIEADKDNYFQENKRSKSDLNFIYKSYTFFSIYLMNQNRLKSKQNVQRTVK